MYNTILVPLDGSEESEAALKTAQTVLSTFAGRKLILLRVLEIPASRSWTSTEILRAKDEETRAVSAYLERVKEQVDVGAAEVEIILHPGPSPAKAIADTAGREKVDLVVMTSHGRSALHQFLLGSQTEKTLRLAPCSVLVVRGAQSD